MRYYSKADYKQWGEWKCAICFYCNFKQHALIYPYPRCQLLCLIQETTIRSQNLVWNQPLKKFDTSRSPKNGLCGVVVEDQEKQIQPRVSEQLNVPPPPTPVLRTLRNHAYRFVPVHFLSWHRTDMLIQCYEYGKIRKRSHYMTLNHSTTQHPVVELDRSSRIYWTFYIIRKQSNSGSGANNLSFLCFSNTSIKIISGGRNRKVSSNLSRTKKAFRELKHWQFQKVQNLITVLTRSSWDQHGHPSTNHWSKPLLPCTQYKHHCYSPLELL